MANPLSLEIQVGFNWFAEWWKFEQQVKEEKERAKSGGRRPSDRVKGEREAREDRDKERTQIQAAYDQYKLDLQIRMARTFVQQHKSEEWFKERYVPEIRDQIRRRLVEFRQAPYAKWQSDLESGVFDEFTLEGIYKNESDGAGGIVEKEEGEATAVGEVLGVQDLVPARGADLRDDSIDEPALLIKTLAPNVSREKIEEFCKEQLGEGQGGFRWLSLSDPNPSKKCHRIGWIMLHPGDTEPMEDVKRGDGRDDDEDGEGEGEVKEETNGDGPKSTSQKALDLVNGKPIVDPVRGDFTCHVGVHNPPHIGRKKALWDLFSAPERIERDLDLAERLVKKFEAELGSDINGFAKIEERVENLRGKGFLQAPIPPPPKPKRNAFEDNDDEIKLDVEEGEEEDSYADDADDEELLVKKKKLDMTVEYLRRVFNFCLFCVFESDSVHELVRKCPGGHLRRPRAGLSSAAKAAAKASAFGQPFPGKKKDGEENGEEVSSPVGEKKPRDFKSKADQQLLRAFNWVKTFEDKLWQILEPETVDLKKIGGKPMEEALEEELSKFIKQEDEAKFRCKVPECTKLFKADHFWRKHVEKRHDEWYQSLKDDVSIFIYCTWYILTTTLQINLVNAYVLDPAHIAPSRTDATSNGHFPVANSNIQSTPRGFNFQTMGGQFGFSGMMPGFGGMQNGNFSGMMPMQSGFSGMGSNMDGHQMHNPGAVRRGGGRFNNRSGPYDRRGGPRHGGNNPFNTAGGPGMGGMRMPAGNGMGYLAQGGGGGGGKWGDGAGGGMTMGPREAVQGRSIKSYEDLDAQPSIGGAGAAAAAATANTSELDY
ncbi:putative arsenite resistance protein ars2 [Phaeomoniella chlamydospora]|uniref:Putative arsenite resistance protein ars2 n=1 Tax=Phaeomoniella chlamydospora TaxID=158046 RepID=A0A0G2DTW1_PHACM|nr:putative arsenite resistance protein ars2 [Phaeomoniella chlamydospora]